jgi:hypothetical protein
LQDCNDKASSVNKMIEYRIGFVSSLQYTSERSNPDI